MIVSEANAEARKVMRDAITEKEQLMGDVRRVQALLRSALAVVDESPLDERTSSITSEPVGWTTVEPARRPLPSRCRRPPTDGDAPETGTETEIRKLAG